MYKKRGIIMIDNKENSNEEILDVTEELEKFIAEVVE